MTSTLFHAGGAEAFVTGAVLSILTAGLEVAFVELPALSLTDADAVRPVPSLEMVLSAVAAPESVGATLSMLMFETVADALLSALSTAVPVTDWLAPTTTPTTARRRP